MSLEFYDTSLASGIDESRILFGVGAGRLSHWPKPANAGRRYVRDGRRTSYIAI